MALALLAIGAAIFIVYSLSQGNTGSIDTSVPTPDTAGIDEGGDGSVPDAVASSTPSNSSVDTLNNSDFTDNSDSGGANVPIVATDPDTWPGGDKIWNVARAIATQEGYGVSAQNAPTRNNNPGDISDGFSQFGGESLDSKITSFPDADTGWNWLYNKLKNVHDGKSQVFSNNMTWLQFGKKYASDPNWANGVTRVLGVQTTDRVGDYWDA